MTMNPLVVFAPTNQKEQENFMYLTYFKDACGERLFYSRDIIPGKTHAKMVLALPFQCDCKSLCLETKEIVRVPMHTEERAMIDALMTHTHDDFSGSIEMNRIVFSLFAHAIEAIATKSVCPLEEKIKQAMKEILSAPESAPEVAALAEKLDTSIYLLQKGFKKLSGMTVYTFVRKARFTKAVHLLETTEKNVTDIALDVGYENPGQFAKMFREHAGITPLAYRNQYLREALSFSE